MITIPSNLQMLVKNNKWKVMMAQHIGKYKDILMSNNKMLQVEGI
jgi:hypothetical protein